MRRSGEAVWYLLSFTFIPVRWLKSHSDHWANFSCNLPAGRKQLLSPPRTRHYDIKAIGARLELFKLTYGHISWENENMEGGGKLRTCHIFLMRSADGRSVAEPSAVFVFLSASAWRRRARLLWFVVFGSRSDVCMTLLTPFWFCRSGSVVMSCQSCSRLVWSELFLLTRNALRHASRTQHPSTAAF